MPPTKRARKTATAHASTAGDSAEASLLDLPSGWEKALSLPSLKQVAARASLERGWQAIGKEHRAELVAALASRAAEWRSFVASVLPLDAALQKATPQSKRSSTKPVDVARCAAVDAAIRASVHLVPSGSGVHLGGGLVLTCAHCVDHDDDEDQDERYNQQRGRRIFVLSLLGETLQVYTYPLEGQAFSDALCYFDGRLLAPMVSFDDTEDAFVSASVVAFRGA